MAKEATRSAVLTLNRVPFEEGNLREKKDCWRGITIHPRLVDGLLGGTTKVLVLLEISTSIDPDWELIVWEVILV